MVRTLASAYPDIAAQWHPELNSGTGPEQIAPTSNRNAHWLGACGHTWEARVANRTARGSGCPYCTGKAVLAGFNDLATTHPTLAAQWSPVNPDAAHEVSAGSSVKAVWSGSCGHEWAATIRDRAQKGSGCPYCAGKAVLAGFNDLATTHPALAAQWHPTRNGDTTPETVTRGSKRNAWWSGPCGHEWEASPNRRTMRPGCPTCSGHRTQAGFNDLATTHPELAAQWHPTRNGGTTPATVTAGADRKAWWSADCGHEWEAWVYDRAGARETGCPLCTRRVSRAEHDLYETVLSLGFTSGQVRRKSRDINGLEFDLIIETPRGPVAVEYNGTYWHSEKFRDRHYHVRKRTAALEAGHGFYAVWEDDWKHRRRVVIRGLAHRLGAYRALTGEPPRVGARELTPIRLGRARADLFLDAHHIQGRTPRPHTHYGLVDRAGSLRAVLSTRFVADGAWEISRYATSGQVPGGFTRLLAHVEAKNQSVTGWVTFADHAVSDGGLYLAHGFEATRTLPPDYSYVGNRNGWRREHKSNYRLARFRDDPNLIFFASSTEKRLAAMNGLYRVWDYGKTRYTKQVRRTDTYRSLNKPPHTSEV